MYLNWGVVKGMMIIIWYYNHCEMLNYNNFNDELNKCMEIE